MAHLTFITFNSQRFATNPNGEDRVIRKINNVGVDVICMSSGMAGKDFRWNFTKITAGTWVHGVIISRFATDDILNESSWGMLLLLFYVPMQTLPDFPMCPSQVYTIHIHMQQM